ncbi:MAG: UDP-N-acetylglucosamine 1-carboxyvinyltransferase [Alphaproteobacteria bacterium]|nr:UDP-N-acetylglucosamine 1-carboxyvinyltransferase [Alphaproteobacteria bacterium]TAD90895.1 MAG: UDP-N-acetylglucosamine 1-carboxyvinyltransferase [Alphaproteobacteria bacterium]
MHFTGSAHSARSVLPKPVGSPEDVLVLKGGRPLQGIWRVDGAKNAALPLMVATLLTDGLVTLTNLPGILDVAVLAELLSSLGVEQHWSYAEIGLRATFAGVRVTGQPDPEGVRRMRASFLILGPLMARTGIATVALPGGDAIGSRPVDIHLDGLRALGAEIEMEHGLITARAPTGLKGARYTLGFPSVGATEHLVMTATLAEGRTELINCAREPEVTDLCRLLAAMGAKIDGIGTDRLTIHGGERLGGAVHRTIPDRIEAGTIIVAAAVSGGRVELRGPTLDDLGAAYSLLTATGVRLTEVEGGLIAEADASGLIGTDFVTQPYPGVATDLQPPLMALMLRAAGSARIDETLFENRFRHVDDLRRLGADITVRGRTALVRGVPRLTGAPVRGTDVRAASCLAIAGLMAEGETILEGLDHLDRGHAAFAERLAALGADVTRHGR